MKEKEIMGSETKNPPESTQLGGTELSEGSNANMHPERVARLGECKKRSRQMGRYLIRAAAGTHPAVAERLTNLSTVVLTCASYLVFNNYYTVDQIKLAKITTCKKHLLCPVCARLRAAKQVRKYAERVQVLRDANPKLKLALLTLTVKNGDDLDERFHHLANSWKKYQARRRDWLKKGWGFNELCKVDGAVFSYEVTNKGNGWHPHLHAVVALNDWVDQSKLSAEWEAITGDSKIVDVRRIKGNPVEGFLEVFKYALKFSELDLDDNFRAYEVLQGRRLQGSFGSFRGVEVPETMTDELLEDLPFIEMYYKFMPSLGAYDLKETKHKTWHGDV
jgi:hypothetical protein